MKEPFFLKVGRLFIWFGLVIYPINQVQVLVNPGLKSGRKLFHNIFIEH
jgi:hypothetical protein